MCIDSAWPKGSIHFFPLLFFSTNNTWKLANSHLLLFQWWLVWFGWILAWIWYVIHEKKKTNRFSFRWDTLPKLILIFSFEELNFAKVMCAISILFALSEPQEHYNRVHVECGSNSYMKIIVSITFSLQGYGIS